MRSSARCAGLGRAAEAVQRYRELFRGAGGELAEEGPDAELTWGEFFARLAALS